MSLSPLARFALFDYGRGSRAYDLAWLLLLALLFLVPPAWLGDPMVVWP